MTTTTSASRHIAPAGVHDFLRRHMLIDGYDLVLDLEKSHGPFLHDAKAGRELLDFFGSFSTVPLGYNHPAMDDPQFQQTILRAAINKPANSDLYTQEMAEFVEAFASTVPDSLDHHLFFIAGGALAVENALKAAFDWKQTQEHRGRAAPPRPRASSTSKRPFTGAAATPCRSPTPIRRRRCTSRSSRAGRGCTTRSSASRSTKRDNAPSKRLKSAPSPTSTMPSSATAIPSAGIVLEPIQGEGGDNHFRPEFMAALRHIADEHEMLLIFDEVQTGFGTTGSWWCFEQLGIEPDIFAFGKKTQVCGIAASRRLDEVESVFHISSRINSTWGGNLVDMIRCHKIVEVVNEDGLLEQAQRTGKVILEGLRELEERFPGKVTNARGRGLFLAVDLPDGKARGNALAACLEHGVLALASGDRSMRFRPPLILDEETAAEGLARLGRAIGSALS